ncbi:MAG: hypothetical protein ABSG88_21940 [Bradyrhizobium sp.]
MSRGAQSFKQGDVTKALKGAVAAGIGVRRVEIDRDGKIVVIAGAPEQVAPPHPANEWDSVK